jgi:hypothetical protein
LEFYVPDNILLAFVTEAEEDLRVIQREVKEQLGTSASLICVENQQLEQERVYSDIKMRALQLQHGVQGYLDQTFTAPDPVMIALQIWTSVHKVLVGNDRTQRSIDHAGLKEFLAQPEEPLGQNGPQESCIFVAEGDKTYCYTSKTSKYSSALGTQLAEVGPAVMLRLCFPAAYCTT